MITVLADDGDTKTGFQLYQSLLTRGAEADYIPLESAEVKPCVNCDACSRRADGRCAVRDDGDWIYPKVVRSDVLILVTPVVFGSYSHRLKRVLDKFGLLMDRRYYIVGGELAKGGLPGRTFKCFAVGVSEKEYASETGAFEDLFHELLVITRGTGRAFVTGAPLPERLKNRILTEVLNA